MCVCVGVYVRVYVGVCTCLDVCVYVHEYVCVGVYVRECVCVTHQFQPRQDTIFMIQV